MSIKKFEKVIATVLRQSMGKGKTVEQVAAAIVARVDEVEVILADVGIEIPTLSAPEPPKQQDWDAIGAQIKPATVDISSRLTPPEKVEEGLVERWTKEKLQSFAQNEMPSELQVKPKDFAEPIVLQKFVESAPGDLAYVRVIYQPKGNPQQIAPTVQVSSTDVRLDADELTDQIITQAGAMFSKTPKVLVPKPPPRMGSLGDLTQGIGVDLDTRDNQALEGNLPLQVGELGQSWKQQRGR